MFLTTGLISPKYDCFVIGSGPAGMTVALELAKANKTVLIFESGDVAAARDDLPTALNFGHLPAGWWNKHSIRALGGTSTVWDGWCASMSESDFDNPAVGVSWPITLRDLLPYYGKAAVILDRDPSIVNFEAGLLPGFLYRPFSVRQDAPTRFGAKYQEQLRTSSAIHVALQYSVTGIDATDNRSSVRRLTYYHHPSKTTRRLTIEPSQVVVVAGGGIGNAQLLLQPRQDGGVPVGNESDLAGRFLMEHPHFVDGAECILDEDLGAIKRPANFGNPIHALVADATLITQKGLHACSIDVLGQNTDHQLARYLSREYGRTFYHSTCMIRTEMRPSASNRVFITGERDAAGFYTHAVRCVLAAEDFLNVETTLRLLGESLIARNKGRIRIVNEHIYHRVIGGGHFMGTTRMGRRRSDSVVDPNCRVHGYNNLYVAGSSVFPSGGYANPTLTIVALALRLAETIAKAA